MCVGWPSVHAISIKPCYQPLGLPKPFAKTSTNRLLMVSIISQHSLNVLGAGGKLRHGQPENIYYFRKEERERDLGIAFHNNKLFRLLLIILFYCCLVFSIIIKVLSLIVLLKPQEEYFQLLSTVSHEDSAKAFCQYGVEGITCF